MKIVVLPESFYHSLVKDGKSKVAIDIHFEPDELCQYEKVKNEIDFTKTIGGSSDIAGEANMVHLEYKCLTEKLDARDIIKKIVLQFQQFSILNLEQKNACLIEADSFKQVAISSDFSDQYNKFMLTITKEEVTSELLGKRAYKQKQEQRAVESISINHATKVNSQLSEAKEDRSVVRAGPTNEGYTHRSSITSKI